MSEAFEQQAATADILNIISNSPTDTQPVFDAIVQSGLKLFPDALISLALRYGDTINAAAIAERDPEGAEAWRRSISRTPLSREYMHGAAMLDCRIVDIPDVRNAPTELAAGARNFLTSGYRAITITPMMRRNEAIGLLSVVRRTPGPLSDKQLSLLRTFAAQAVIAIENTRLLNELRQRTDDLSESLEQQTATSEVLKVISSSTGELHPVFQAMLENAVQICEAKFGVLFRYEDGKFRQAAMLNVPTAHADSLRQRDRFVPEPGVTLDRMLKTKRLIHTLDEAASVNPAPSARLGGARSHIAVPMVKDDELVGAIVIYRQEVRPFTDKQIELVQNFAAQAVIAIENTRLLNELRQRTDDLSEALEQQTATSEVLGVISSSPGELEPVFESMLENAVRICEAKFGTMFRNESGVFHPAAVNAEKEFAEFVWRRGSFQPPPGTPLGRLLRSGEVICTADEAAEPNPGSAGRLAGARSLVAVPMLKEKDLIGASPSTATKCGRSPTSRSSWSETLPIRPSSPSRTRGCSTSCVNRSSSRPPPPTCSRSLAARPSTLQPVLEPCWSRRRNSAKRNGAIIRHEKGDVLLARRWGAPRRSGGALGVTSRRHARERHVVGRVLRTTKTVHIPDVLADPEYSMFLRDSKQGIADSTARAPSSPFRCSRRMSQSASLSYAHRGSTVHR